MLEFWTDDMTCPICDQGIVFYNVDRANWACCEPCRLKWWWGSGFFRDPDGEDEKGAGANRAFLSSFVNLDDIPEDAIRGRRMRNMATVEGQIGRLPGRVGNDNNPDPDTIPF
jgi:hypothetical protein